MATLVLAGLLHTIWFYSQYGYLPQPFLYDLGDPLMDLYWTTWWGHQPGPYRVWNSIYPPLSFVFTRLLSNPGCYLGDAFSARDCDVALRWLAVYGVMLLNAGLLWRAFKRTPTGGCAVSRAFVVSFGFPALFAGDRGNLILPCFTCFILAFGPLMRPLAWRAAALATAINFKPYLLVLMAVPLVLRKGSWFMWTAGVGLAIYLASFALLGTGSPMELLSNFRVFGSEQTENHWERVFASTSFTPLIRFANSDFPWLLYFDSNVLDGLVEAAQWMMRAGLAGALLCFALAATRQIRLPDHRVAALAITLLLVMSELGGGYAMLFVVFLTLFEPWRGGLRGAMLVCAYLLCIPSDYIFMPMLKQSADAWWSNQTVYSEFGAAVGQVLRPLLMTLILYGHIALALQRTAMFDGSTELRHHGQILVT
jgi:hypothetical protein